jgi:hypothetical protein
MWLRAEDNVDTTVAAQTLSLSTLPLLFFSNLKFS